MSGARGEGGRDAVVGGEEAADLGVVDEAKVGEVDVGAFAGGVSGVVGGFEDGDGGGEGFDLSLIHI